MNDMILAAQIEAIAPTGPVIVGVSSDPYLDDTTSPTLWQGVYLPVITGDITWAEHARHPWQDTGPELAIGDCSLDNHKRYFDEWPRWTLTGRRFELRRGPRHLPWADMELVLIAQVASLRWEGRRSVTLTLESLLQALREPFAREVFDDTTPNETLVNTLRPRALGPVFQVRPPLVNPALLRFYFDGDPGRVAEGGNPTENWQPSIDGIQLTQNFQQVITLDGAGPLLADAQRDDVLEAIGSFASWTEGVADGWTFTTDPPDSDFSEASAGGLDVIATAAIDGNVIDSAGNAETPELQSGANYEPVNASTLSEAVAAADDGKYARLVTGSDTGVKRLWADNFGIELPPDTVPVGVQLRVRFRSVGTSNPSPYTRWRLGTLIDGSFEAIMAFSGDDFDFPYDWPSDWETRTYGTTTSLPAGGLSVEQAESEDLAIQITFRRVTSGTVDVQIDHIELIVHYGPLITPPKAVTTDELVTPGDLYTLRVVHDGEGSVRLRWATVDETTDPVPVGADPYQPNQAQLDGPGTYEALVTATGPRLALEFDRGSGDGLQTLPLVQLIERGQGISRYNAQVPYVVAEMGLDPELHVDQAMIDAHDDATGHLPLGTYINDSMSAHELLTRKAGSLGGPLWEGLDARVRSFKMEPPPAAPDNPENFLHLEDNQIADDVEIWHDNPPHVTDRATGADNQHPIPESGLSTITSTWTEADRQAAMAQSRVTRKVDWDDLTGFEAVSS